MYSHLPIYSILESIKVTLDSVDTLILSSPPGSGKTTVVPIYLMDYYLKKILVLEPRRLAAKNSAERASYLINEKTGNRVGFRTRYESRVSPTSRVEFITEGIFLKKIQNDPELMDVDIVIFDEFHERSLNSDLSLALLMETKKLFNPNLKVILMSATISPHEIQEKIPNSKVIIGDGSLYPVNVEYINKFTSINQHIKEIISRRDLPEGNILIFLPGAGEITRAIEEFQKENSEFGIAMPLYSELDDNIQKQIFSITNKRKVIFSTNIAETSITIDGVSIVIDSGYQKRNYYNSNSGMNSLKIERISLDSAEQRKGRAGRVSSGKCFRLWTKEEEKDFLKYTPPQIKYSDLSDILLHTKKFGVDINSLLWIDPPNQIHLNKAEEILKDLGALNENGDINELGKKILEIPLPNRLSIMIFKAQKFNSALKALELSVILSERLFSNKNESIDISIIYEYLKNNEINKYYNKFRRNCVSIRNLFSDLKDDGKLSLGALLALSYPDRIAKKREFNSDTYKFINGQGGYIQISDSTLKYEYIVVPELDSRSGNSKIFLFAEIHKEEIIYLFSERIKIKEILSNHGGDRFKVLYYKMLGEIILEEREELNPNIEAVEKGILGYLSNTKCVDLNWDSKVINFINRIRNLNTVNPSFPNLDIEEMKGNPIKWIGSYLTGIRRISELRNLDLYSIIKSGYTYKGLQEIDNEAPEYFIAPSGRNIKIEYGNNEIEIHIKLQELFGLLKSPKYIYGTIHPTFHLLSPAGRPIQVTKDLESFWLNTYKDVRKELRGRYPKHPWPEDPLSAIPTHKTTKGSKLKNL